MPTILHLVKTLVCRPTLLELPGIRLRQFAGPPDIETWLDLRHCSFAGEPVGVREWTRADFEADFLSKPWWSPERLWFAEALPVTNQRDAAKVVGTVALGQRGELPVVHWLCVLPDWRRRGIGRLLLSALEVHCWDEGRHVVGLETHARWEAAFRFYRALGYEQEEEEVRGQGFRLRRNSPGAQQGSAEGCGEAGMRP
jgi:GNAT superfamily N-acetyltransferase